MRRTYSHVNVDAILKVIRSKELCSFAEVSIAGIGYIKTESKALTVKLHDLEREGKIKRHDVRHGSITRRMYSAGSAI